MSKEYDTGKDLWNHNQKCMYENGRATHVFLGPCPDCGAKTFDYGGGWRCIKMYCTRSSTNSSPSVGNKPAWWDTNMNVKLDGDQWCAYRDDFINLQESISGWGSTPDKAVDDLIEHEIIVCPNCDKEISKKQLNENGLCGECEYHISN